ncbi:hypothetical protein OAS81_04510 [Gammaproteobacteria bacterium]|nr:hypothetical protein [Gammaproteobacteria bacterium]
MKLPVVELFSLKGIKLEEVFEKYFCRAQEKRHKNVSEYKLNSIKESGELESILAYVEKKFHLEENGFDLCKLWLVESVPDDIRVGELPFVPHIDYRRFLKVMIYVDDVTDVSGPFSAIKTNPDDFESFRLGLTPNYKNGRDNQIVDFSLDKFEKFTGPKGTMILFDTNCPHYAAAVFEGNRRRVFRFDYERPEWTRKESSLSKIKTFISRPK